MSPTPSSIINFSSFRREASEWKRFGRTLALIIFLPLICAFLFCEFTGWATGEFLPDQVSADRQRADSRLIWFAHNDRDVVHFKLLRVAQERPEVLIMGQSRMSQFRAPMFAPYHFYNLSHISWPINTLAQILEHFPTGYAPQVIFFNLDYFLFSPHYDSDHLNATPRFESPDWSLHFRSLHECLTLLQTNPSLFDSKSTFPTIGLHAFTQHHGFRQDGSELWRTDLEASAGRDPDLLNHVNWDLDPLCYRGDTLDQQELAELGTFAEAARARGIKLVGLQMPIYGPVLDALLKGGKCGMIGKTQTLFSNGYFDRLGIIAFDYLKFPPYSDDYRCFQDAAHATEPVSAAILLKVAADPRIQAILPRLNAVALQQKLDLYEKSNWPEHIY